MKQGTFDIRKFELDRRGTNGYRKNVYSMTLFGLTLKKDNWVLLGIILGIVLLAILVILPHKWKDDKLSMFINNSKVYAQTHRVTPTPEAEVKKSELSEIVAYITQVFEPEGKEVVVQAINCFYSESGLRANAVGQNNDAPRSKDHGVAQLNDYWHNLTEEEKTSYKANIDKAYKIYKGRGGNFSAWYGKRCN